MILNFNPAEQQLYVLSCAMNFGLSTDTTDNGSEIRLVIYHTYLVAGNITHSGAINGIEINPMTKQHMKQILDVHRAQHKKGKKGLVLGNLPNNIYQDATITGVVVAANNNNNNNDATLDNVLHANNDGVEMQCTGVPGNDGVETQRIGVSGNMKVHKQCPTF